VSVFVVHTLSLFGVEGFFVPVESGLLVTATRTFFCID